MSRDPSRRWASAREFAEALRDVQGELGFAPTPLEIADDEWGGASGAVDFGDTELRGPARSRVERENRRKTRDAVVIAALARDEDTDFAAPTRSRRSALPWVVGGIAAVATAIAAVVVTLFATGVL